MILVTEMEQQFGTVEEVVAITKDVLLDLVSAPMVTPVNDCPLSLNSPITVLFYQWFKGVIFSRDDTMSPANFLNDHVRYSVPAKVLSRNDVLIFFRHFERRVH